MSKTQVDVALARVGTCMAWQWMCPEFCGFVIGICADKTVITSQAAKHLAWHDG